MAIDTDLELPERQLDVAMQPRATFRRHVLLRWGTLRTALGQVSCGALLVAVGLAVIAGLLEFGGLLLGLGELGFQGVGSMGQLTAKVMGLFILLGVGLMLVGVTTCFGAPRQFGGHDLIKGTICCIAAMVAFLCLNFFLELFIVEPIRHAQHIVQPIPKVMPGPAAQDNSRLVLKLLHKAAPYFLLLASFLAGVFFVLFMRRMAQIAGDEAQQKHALTFLGAYAALSIGLAVCTYLSGKLLQDNPTYLAISMVVTAGYFGWFAMLASRVRAAITHMLLGD